MRRWLRISLGMAVSLLFLFLFFYRVDLGEMVRVLGRANYLLAFPAGLIYIGAMGVRAVRWRVLLEPVAATPVRQLFPVLVMGYMMSNLLPLRVGELFRAYYLGGQIGVSRTAIFATVVVERVLDGIALLFLIALVSPLTPLGGVMEGVAQTMGVSPTVLALALALPFLLALGVLVAAAYALPRWGWLGKLSRLGGLATLFVLGLSTLKNPRRFMLAFLLSVAVWLADTPVYVVMAYAFGLPDSLSWGELLSALVLTMSIANLVTAIPSSSGGVGPYEFFGKGVLVVLGVSGALATAYILTIHLVLIVSVSLPGLVYLWWRSMGLPWRGLPSS